MPAIKKPTTRKIKKAVEETRKPVKKPEVQPLESAGEHYFETVGRRKTSSARIRIAINGDKEILVNDKPYQVYFPTLETQEIVLSPLKLMSCLDKFRIIAKVNGGGMHSQAEAVRHGIARALLLFNADFRKRLKKAGYLTRDPRMRERKKFGLKRARRAPQWRKR
ncbi:MAG: 30S ribosomal protein S9 [Candidatus Nealsonbacteria bacterium]|nr:30S ribosomal protein S9 [Candidatus Nealsonbacteria bacterium]